MPTIFENGRAKAGTGMPFTITTPKAFGELKFGGKSSELLIQCQFPNKFDFSYGVMSETIHLVVLVMSVLFTCCE